MNKKKRIISLFILIFLMGVVVNPILFSSFGQASVQEEGLTIEWGDNIYQNIPYWFSGTFYETTDYTFAYSNAKLELEYIPDNSIYYNETITEDFSNMETQYGDPSNINMINGTTDSADNMDSDDSSYTTFTSTHTDGYIYETPSQWDNFTFGKGTGDTIGEIETIDANYSVIDSSEAVIVEDEFLDSISLIIGSEGGGSIANTMTDDSNYYQIDSVYHGFPFNNQVITALFNFDPTYGGRDFYLSLDMAIIGTSSIDFRVNGISEESGSSLDFDDYLYEDVISMSVICFPQVASFSLRIYYFKIIEDASPTPAEVDVQVDMQITDPDISSIEFLKYSHKTDISVDIDLDIWNWDTTTWYEIESVDNSATFDDDSFTLGSASDYVNSSNGVRIRFQGSESSNFDLQIDRLRLDYLALPEAELDMEILFQFSSFTNTSQDILQINVLSEQKTNISQNIVFQIWNFNTSSYEVISNTTETTSSTNRQWFNSTNLREFINSSGIVKLYWNATNPVNDFDLYIDYLYVSIYNKTQLSYSKTLLLLGTWKYRFHLDVGLGSYYSTDWIYFNVIEQQANFEGISESKYTTKWVLTSTETTGERNTVWEDLLTDDYWILSGASIPTITITGKPSADAWIWETTPDVNYGLLPYSILKVYMYPAPSDHKYTYLQHSLTTSYFTSNLTDAYLEVNVDNPSSSNIYVYIMDDSFVEDEITWNNRITDITFALGTWDWSSTGFTEKHFNKGIEYKTFMIGGGTNDEGSIFSREYLAYGYDPDFFYDYSKVYHDTSGEGSAYMQTDTTETLGLKSPTFTDESLSEGDLFVVDLQTTSDNAQLLLYNDGVLQKTINVLTANVDYDRQEVEVYVDSDVTFDQVKITSSFTSAEYLKLYDINADHWTFESSEDQSVLYVNPFGKGEVIVNLGNNSLKIYENDILQTDTYITIGYDLTTYIYQSPLPETVFVSFYDSNNEILNFNKFVVYVDYTINDILFEDQRLGSNEFFVDEGSYIGFDVYDSFNSSIYQANRLAKTFIDITLNVYELKIKNEKLIPVEYKLKNNDTAITKSGYLFESEILEYKIASGTYIFEYLKEGESEWENFTFSFTSNQIFVLNRSKICFLSYSNQRAEYLEFSNYKTYINGTLLYENVFYRDIGVSVGIEIKDRYDISIKNETYQVISGDNYIPIILTEYSLKVMNQQEIFNHINITRDPNYYESPFSWSEWVAPNEIIKFRLFPGYYKINLTDNEGSSYSFYEYTLSGDDVLLISSDNILSQVIYNIANVNTTIGNQITNVEINITNQNSNINNTIVNIQINLDNVNSTLGNLLVSQGIQITNIENNITSLYTFTNNSFINLNNVMNTSFIYIENNIIAINQSISTLVIGIDGKISIVNATINTMFTEMSNQFIITQSTINYSFAFLNQTIIQIGNNITSNYIALQNLIIQRANDIDSSLINIQNLINLVNNTVANESLVIQTLINLIGSNITSNHIIINSLLNLIDNNITNNNIQLVSILDVIGNNITTNHFVIQTLLDLVGNNITNNHLELITNLNLINNTIDQNQIELINRLLFINNSINAIALDLTNQLIFLNNTIYSAILNVSVSIDFASDNILGNITLTYQQNDFLTELYKRTMFSQLLNWSDVAYNYTLMEDRIDVWEFINNYKNDSVQVLLRYNNLIDNLTVSAQNTVDQYLPREDVEYRLKSITTGEYLNEWEPLPENRSVDFGFYSTEIPVNPIPLINSLNMLVWFAVFVVFILFIIIVLYMRFAKEKASIPIELKQYIKKKKKSKSKRNVFSNRDIYID